MMLDGETVRRMAACFAGRTCCRCGRTAVRLAHRRFYCDHHFPGAKARRRSPRSTDACCHGERTFASPSPRTFAASAGLASRLPPFAARTFLSRRLRSDIWPPCPGPAPVGRMNVEMWPTPRLARERMPRPTASRRSCRLKPTRRTTPLLSAGVPGHSRTASAHLQARIGPRRPAAAAAAPCRTNRPQESSLAGQPTATAAPPRTVIGRRGTLRPRRCLLGRRGAVGRSGPGRADDRGVARRPDALWLDLCVVLTLDTPPSHARPWGTKTGAVRGWRGRCVVVTR